MFKHIARRSAQQISQRPSTVAAVGRRHVHTPVPFDWQDPLGTKNLFTEEELAISETAESYCQERMLPRVLGMLHYPATCVVPLINRTDVW